MAGINLFSPKTAGTVSISATSSSQRVALGNTVNSTMVVRVKNADTTNFGFIELGSSTVTAATTTGFPIGPGESFGLTVPAGCTHAAAISGATCTIYFSIGYGV